MSGGDHGPKAQCRHSVLGDIRKVTLTWLINPEARAPAGS